jgi:hypothetical protein
MKNIIKKILKEESSNLKLPPQIRRRIRYDEEQIINYLKKFAIIGLRYNTIRDNTNLDSVIRKACSDAAHEIVDSTQTSDGDLFDKMSNDLSKFLEEKYGEEIKEFAENFYSPSGNKLGNIYTFWKHADRYGGNGFSESFETWNQLLKSYATWFPDLDWKELKNKLDNMESKGKILIKKPGDKYNNMGYYFSLIRRDAR